MKKIMKNLGVVCLTMTMISGVNCNVYAKSPVKKVVAKKPKASVVYKDYDVHRNPSSVSGAPKVVTSCAQSVITSPRKINDKIVKDTIVKKVYTADVKSRYTFEYTGKNHYDAFASAGNSNKVLPIVLNGIAQKENIDKHIKVYEVTEDNYCPIINNCKFDVKDKTINITSDEFKDAHNYIALVTDLRDNNGNILCTQSKHYYTILARGIYTPDDNLLAKVNNLVTYNKANKTIVIDYRKEIPLCAYRYVMLKKLTTPQYNFIWSIMFGCLSFQLSQEDLWDYVYGNDKVNVSSVCTNNAYKDKIGNAVTDMQYYKYITFNNSYPSGVFASGSEVVEKYLKDTTNMSTSIAKPYIIDANGIGLQSDDKYDADKNVYQPYGYRIKMVFRIR